MIRVLRLPLFARKQLAAGVLCAVAGCGGSGDGSGNAPQGPIVGASSGATICPGTDVSKLASKVYVSTAGTDADGCGASTTNACATIGKGIANCAASGCAVLVQHGLYQSNATVQLRDGVSVFGTCLFDGEPDRGYRTVIQASTPPGSPAVLADFRGRVAELDTTFANIVVVGKDETTLGTASIAMVVQGSRRLTLTATVLVGGRGGDGTSGSSAQVPVPFNGNGDGGSQGAAGAGGFAGKGGQSCPAHPPNDGSGNGANGLQSFQRDGCFQRIKADDGQASGGVAGGVGGAKGKNGINCPEAGGLFGPFDGNPGNPGAAGECGRPAQASLLSAGSFAGAGDAAWAWVPSRGNDGEGGKVGSGGGGGGAGGVCSVGGSNFADYPGLPGGGGGGGGCGGGGGGSGQQGGASLALVAIDSLLTRDPAQNALIPGPAGRGGDAGNAVHGGQGGFGGPRQDQGKVFYFFFGCGGSGEKGGDGGWGGAGSAGAAGNGGPSIGLAYAGTTPAPGGADGVYAPAPGAPGAGATGGTAAPVASACNGANGPAGLPGVGALAFQLDAAENPAASLLTAGAQLAPGETRTSPDGAVEFIMQADGNLCLYKSGAYQWCSIQDVPGAGTSTGVTMETTGNLCLQPSGPCVLQSGPPLRPWSYVQVRNDGHVVITDGAVVYWKVP